MTAEPAGSGSAIRWWQIDDDEDGVVSRWHVHSIAEDKRHPWRHYRLFINDRNGYRTETGRRAIDGRIEWNLLPRHGFGTGFEFTHNGDEDHGGVSLYAGRLGSLWLHFTTPWTRWLRLQKTSDDDKDYYKPRKYGIRLFPHNGCWFRAEWDARSGEWSSNQPWYREIKLLARHLWGRVNSEKVVEDQGDCIIPMPEGTYPAKWEKAHYERRHVRWPGTWRDRLTLKGPLSTVSIEDVPGGIPHWGKGENSYDCGMDGCFGISGGFRTIEAAIGGMVESSLRDRKKYGGLHDLPRPMTVKEAEEWALSKNNTGGDD